MSVTDRLLGAIAFRLAALLLMGLVAHALPTRAPADGGGTALALNQAPAGASFGEDIDTRD